MDRIGLVVLEENTISDKRFYSLNERAGNRIEALEAFIKQFYATDSLPERIVTEKQLKIPISNHGWKMKAFHSENQRMDVNAS